MSALIYAKVAAVMAEVDHVAKRDRNQAQNFSFRGIDAVVNAVGPALRKHGVIVVPEVQSVTYETAPTKSGGTVTVCRVIVDYTFWAEDGSSLKTQVAGEAFDSGDKATAKAMSVAFRTALLQALALPTDEADPDSQTYERAAPSPGSRPASDAQLNELGVQLKAAGITDVPRYINETVGRPVGGFSDLSVTECSLVLNALRVLGPDAPEGEA